MNKIKAGILGCTGLVGQQFVRMLDRHPFFEVAFLSASKKSTGKRYSEAADWVSGACIPAGMGDIIVTEAAPGAMKEMGVKVIFSALPSSVARKTERNLARAGFFIFTNASSFRMDPDVPIVIPEVNSDHFELVKAQSGDGRGFIVANSNCSVAGLVMGLKPLSGFGLRSVAVTTYQALSGAGRRGVSSLDILGNVIPYIKDEEEKIERETKKALGQMGDGFVRDEGLEVNASCCRVSTRVGHLESIVVETEDDPEIKAVIKALESFRGIPQSMQLPTAPERPVIVANEANRPQPVLDSGAGVPARAKGMAVTVGRIRKKGKKINFFLLVHNTIRGAAGTCILNAEFAVKKSRIK